jgi:hypothetical protein
MTERTPVGLTARELDAAAVIDEIRDNFLGPRKAARIRKQVKAIILQETVREPDELLARNRGKGAPKEPRE